jgi:di/tricarboxylate transporter
MGWESWVTLAVLATCLGTLAWGRFSPDLILVGAVTLLATLGILSPHDALSGIGNEGTITVGVLFVVATGLRETGGMQLILQYLLGRPTSVVKAQTRLLFPAAFLSAFMNNIPLVAMLLPGVTEWAKKRKFSVSKLLIPLSYASILGGMCTLIGTSTNLIVNGRYLEYSAGSGEPGFGLFEIALLGVPCALVGLTYLLLFSRRLLKDRVPVMSALDNAREYSVEMLVEPNSPLVGQTIEAAGLRHLPGMYLMEIDRAGGVLAAVPPHEILEAHDRLIFVGAVESVVDLQTIRGLTLATDQVFKLDAPRSQRCLVEAVVSDSCPVLGRTVRRSRFRTVYNAVIIAVARNGQRIRKKVGDIVIRTGDVLLLECHPEFVNQQRNLRDFYLVSRLEGLKPPIRKKAWLALTILVAMVLVAGFGVVSMLNAALLAAGLMILTRCCSWATARRSVDWQLLLTVAAALGLGKAVENTGLADFVANGMLGRATDSPQVALFMVYGLTILFTELITNNAAAVLVFPIAMKTAVALGVSPLPFVATIMMAASASFATPLGYQTNLMVYGPGGYRYSDYLKIGLPLNLLLWGMTAYLAPQIWPF